MKNLDTIILEFLENNPLSSSKDIYDGISSTKGYATIKRSLNNLIEQNYISKEGKGKGTKYLLSSSYSIIRQIDIEEYFTQDIDDRKIQSSFNFKLISEILPKVELFSQSELQKLQMLQKQFQNNINLLSTSQYENELERLAIDLSWKSSQIEGNTYSLLETERLLKEKLTADGKTKEKEKD